MNAQDIETILDEMLAAHYVDYEHRHRLPFTFDIDPARQAEWDKYADATRARVRNARDVTPGGAPEDAPR